MWPWKHNKLPRRVSMNVPRKSVAIEYGRRKQRWKPPSGISVNYKTGQEARRRTKVVGAFPDGHSALMLVAARLRHVSATRWGTRKYMNMKLLDEAEKEMRFSVA